MNSFLDWLDEAAGGLIRFAYLAAGITAVAVYFGAGTLPPRADALLNAALPWALAFALETHTYLTSRRVRATWQERDRNGLLVNIGVLAVLLAFSAWNQLGYLSGSWTPPHTGPLALPTWAAYGVRALIVPVAFMAAAFLAPLAAPITAQIEQEARNVLADVFRIARKQRQRMLKEAQRSGRDLTGALVELVGDDETRRIIAHAYGAIRPADPAESSPAENYTAEQAIADVRRHLGIDYPPQLAAITSAGESNTGDSPLPPVPPDDDGGSPSSLASRLGHAATPAPNVTPLRRSGLGRKPRTDRRTASRANGRSGKRGTVERRIRDLLAREPHLTQDDLVRRIGCSPSSASKWMAVIEAERGAGQAQELRA